MTRKRFKRVMSIMLAVMMIFAMTACASADTVKEKDNPKDTVTKQEEDAVEKDTKKETAETETVEPTEKPTEEETAEPTEEPSKPKEKLTGDTKITDEDMQEVYDAIAEGIKKDYLEPNGMTAADLVWPTNWNYFDNLLNYQIIDSMSSTENEIVDISSIPSDLHGNTELIQVIFVSTMEHIMTKGVYDYAYLNNFYQCLQPYESIPEKVTFEE